MLSPIRFIVRLSSLRRGKRLPYPKSSSGASWWEASSPRAMVQSLGRATIGMCLSFSITKVDSPTLYPYRHSCKNHHSCRTVAGLFQTDQHQHQSLAGLERGHRLAEDCAVG